MFLFVKFKMGRKLTKKNRFAHYQYEDFCLGIKTILALANDHIAFNYLILFLIFCICQKRNSHTNFAE